MRYQKKHDNSPCGAQQGIGLRNFLQKLLAIAPNSSVVAFFFFPHIQFVVQKKQTSYQIKKSDFKIINENGNIKKWIKKKFLKKLKLLENRLVKKLLKAERK
jgi:sulfur relay (sulfurtransferase) DsrF/TusC family protein